MCLHGFKWRLCNCIIFISKCIDGVIKSIEKIGGWTGSLSNQNFFYVVNVATFGHKHHQITPSNHASQTNSNEFNKGVSLSSILHNLPNLRDWSDLIITPI